MRGTSARAKVLEDACSLDVDRVEMLDAGDEGTSESLSKAEGEKIRQVDELPTKRAILLSAKQMNKVLKREKNLEICAVLVKEIDGLMELSLLDKEAMLRGYELSKETKENGINVDEKFVKMVEGIQNAEIRAVLSQFEDRFPSDLPGLPPSRPGFDVPIALQEGTKPFFRGLPKYSPAQLSEMREQITYLLDRGLIEPSSSPWGSAVLFVPKKGGALRMCVDYRMLNKATIKNKFPLPHIEEHLTKLGGAKIFSKLDLRSGYWQLRLEDQAKELTGFRTRYGHFQWRILPFGLCNAPGHFSHLVTELFREFLDIFVLIYIDDILVFIKSASEHASPLQLVLENLREVNLFAKVDKCNFAQ